MRTRVRPGRTARLRSSTPHGVALLGTVLLAGLLAAGPAGALGWPFSHARVLRVGTWHGIAGDYTDIQSAVDDAQPGDWILVAPGDYHEQGDRVHPLPGEASGGVVITTNGIHLRGMNRNQVIVDGTLPGAPPCSSDPADQDFGPIPIYNGPICTQGACGSPSAPLGRNGVLVFEADGVTVENLTACNFLAGSYGGGNQIWFNGGDGSGQIGMGSYYGAFLSATSTYWEEGEPQGEYGIFVSNAKGPGVITDTYASNMADSSYYIGACPDCNAWLLHAHAQNSALGYSGTNSGGHLVVAFSEWDQNKTGISTNSQNNDDAPSPQDGACPDGAKGLLGTDKCTFFIGNYIHDNNNPDVPGSGTAELGPVGTGMVVAGGRNDTIAWNRVQHNGSWALLLVPFPDTGSLDAISHCQGGEENPGGLLGALGVTCYYNDWGNQVYQNLLSGNGFFGNNTNGDLGDVSDLHDPGNCWHNNFDPAGVTSSPADLQTTNGTCGVPNQGSQLGDPLSVELICASGLIGPCPGLPGEPGYPQRTQVSLMPLPKERSMPDPCAGVPSNPWCPRRWFW
jgi:hypothetical protein